MKLFLLVSSILLFLTGAFSQKAENDTGHGKTANPDSVLAWLKSGNEDFLHGKFNAHGIDSGLRMAISKEQHPRAVILTCSDSRVPPELIFDKGLGDLFVVRVAGNISDDAVIGSIEYAVEHLHTPLIVVMGHQGCGAIAAAVEDLQGPENKIDNHIRTLTDRIEQAITTINLNENDFMQKALLSNILFTIRSLKESRPVLNESVKHGQLKIIGAIYALSSGKVTWLEN